MKTLITILTVFLFEKSFAQQISIPENYSIMDSVSGDLDKDGINELVVAYNTKTATEEFESVPRELIIYKRKGEQWIAWKKSNQVLLGSRDGGIMGDPFVGMEIKRGALFVNHYGGSAWRWGYTDVYRYQNSEFYLIGYNSTWGHHCDELTTMDCNLSTGKINVKTEYYQDCEKEMKSKADKKETFFRKGITITFEKRRKKEVIITSPKYKHKIYIAHGE